MSPQKTQKGPALGGSEVGGRERAEAIEAPGHRLVRGVRKQRELARMQLWEDKGKDRLVCHIVRKDQQGMSQDDFNDIHYEVMDAVVDFGQQFGEEGQPESPEGADRDQE